MRRNLVTLLAALLLTLAPLAAEAQTAFRYAPVEVGPGGPGSTTTVVSVNDAGEIVGLATGPGYFYGFVRGPKGGTAPISLPRGVSVPLSAFVPAKVNGSGAVLGFYTDLNGVDQGALMSSNGAVVKLGSPGIGTGGVFLNDINNAGLIVGTYTPPDGSSLGFLRGPNGRFVTLNPPGVSDMNPAAINASGVIIGNYTDATNGSVAFVRGPDGRFANINVPGSAMTFPAAINAGGVVAGTYLDADNIPHGFLRGPKGNVATLDFPGTGTTVFGTFLYGINDRGHVFGSSLTASSGPLYFFHGANGFVTIDFPGGSDSSTVVFGMNNKDEIVGAYGRANDTIGFLAAPSK